MQNQAIKEGVVSLMKSFNLGIEDLVVDDNEQLNTMDRVKAIHKNGYLTLREESMGTRKLLMALTPIYLSLRDGCPLVIDELDAKIHPKMLEYTISLFTNPKINQSGSQLIFTSHDMYTLSNIVFRRDEVWFVAKDLEDSSIFYSLVDIKNENNEKERKDASFSKRYLEGKYGADPFFNRMLSWSDINGK